MIIGAGGDGEIDPDYWAISDRDVFLYRLSGRDPVKFWQLHHVPRERLERFVDLFNLDVGLNDG